MLNCSLLTRCDITSSSPSVPLNTILLDVSSLIIIKVLFFKNWLQEALSQNQTSVTKIKLFIGKIFIFQCVDAARMTKPEVTADRKPLKC